MEMLRCKKYLKIFVKYLKDLVFKLRVIMLKYMLRKSQNGHCVYLFQKWNN